MNAKDVLGVIEAKEGLENLLNGMKKLARMRPTYCGYLAMELSKAVKTDFDMTDCHYTGSGVVAVLHDKIDGRDYSVTINVEPPKGNHEV